MAKKVISRATRRASPLFLILILATLIPYVHASSYVGYNQSNCPGSPCSAKAAFTNLYGIGETVRSPFPGSLVAVGVYAADSSPTKLIILTSTQAVTGFDTGCQSQPCGSINDNLFTFTVKDSESISLTPNAFSTIDLANPVTVTNGQFVAIIVVGTTGGACNATTCIDDFTTGGSASILGTCFNFGSNSPSIGNSYTARSTASSGDSNCNATYATLLGGSFNPTNTGSSVTTACYGNCGSPPVTVVNTNSTHSINFNQSITLLYEFQSNLNGFILNETLNVAKNYNNGEGMTLGIYTVDSACPIGVSPFSPQCPGFLQAKATYQTLFKGGGTTNRLIAGSIPVTNGQWVGVAVSGFFQGLDLNDTNTGVQLFQASGQVQSVIQQSSQFSASSLIGIQLWIHGNFATSTGGTPTSAGNCSPACYLGNFVDALGGGVFGGLVAFGVLFGIIGGGLMYVTRQHDSEGHIKGYAIPTWFLGIIAVLLLLGMSAAGALPPYIPVIIIALVAWLLASSIWKNRSEQGGTGATM